MDVINRIELLTKTRAIAWYKMYKNGNMVGFWDKFRVYIKNKWTEDEHYFSIVIKNNRGIIIYRDDVFNRVYSVSNYNKLSVLLSTIDEKSGEVMREELGWFMGKSRYL